MMVNNRFVRDPNLFDTTLIRVITKIAIHAVSLMAQSGIAFGSASACVAWNMTRHRYSLVRIRDLSSFGHTTVAHYTPENKGDNCGAARL